MILTRYYQNLLRITLDNFKNDLTGKLPYDCNSLIDFFNHIIEDMPPQAARAFKRGSKFCYNKNKVFAALYEYKDLEREEVRMVLRKPDLKISITIPNRKEIRRLNRKGEFTDLLNMEVTYASENENGVEKSNTKISLGMYPSGKLESLTNYETETNELFTTPYSLAQIHDLKDQEDFYAIIEETARERDKRLEVELCVDGKNYKVVPTPSEEELPF